MQNLANYFDQDNLQQIFSKVKAAVYNYTEYQAKVMEATNGDNWGCSSTLMQEIANGTHNPIHFNDIMETLYKKLQERGVNWRQCYKALQLLEYLIKNGSERVVDNSKDHVYELKALKNFNHIDEKMKDQGLNVRNRAKEIAELLGDNNKIRDERKKAKENKQKYIGASSNSSSSMSGTGFGSNSGGFGNPDRQYGGQGNNYNGGSSSSGFRDSDDSPTRSPPKSKAEAYNPPVPVESAANSSRIQIVMKGENAAATVKTDIPNLLDMGPSGGKDDEWGDFAAVKPMQSTAKPASPLDDFAAFQTSLPNAAGMLFMIQHLAIDSTFSSYSTPVPTATGFANFGTTPSANLGIQQASMGFNNNVNQQKPMGFNQGPPMMTMNNQTQHQPMMGYSGLPINQSLGFQQPMSSNFNKASSPMPSQTSFAAFGAQSSTLAQKTDPFSKLVSLDPKSLSTMGAAKAVASGPSLNAIQQKPSDFQYGGFEDSSGTLI